MKKVFLSIGTAAMAAGILMQPVSAENSLMTFRFKADRTAVSTAELAKGDAVIHGGLHIENYTGIAELRMILCSDAPILIENGGYTLDPSGALDADGNPRHAFFEEHSTAMYTQKSLIDDSSNIILWAGAETNQANAFHANGVVRNADASFVSFDYRIPKGTPAGDYTCYISQNTIRNAAGFIEEDLTVSDQTHELQIDKDFAAAPITISVYTRGDVNCDGNVSIDDAQLALILYTEQNIGLKTLSDDEIADIVHTKSVSAAQYAAEASENGELEITDAQGILSYYVSAMSSVEPDWDDIF